MRWNLILRGLLDFHSYFAQIINIYKDLKIPTHCDNKKNEVQTYITHVLNIFLFW